MKKINNDQQKNKADSTNLNSASAATLEYSGKIKVSYCKGNKVVKSKTYSNTGCGPLFKFIALSLQGDYRMAEKYRPVKVKLFNNLASHPENWSWDVVKPITNFITTTTTSDIAQISDEDGKIIGYKTILHFLVPAVLVDKSSISNNINSYINQICLYSGKELNEQNCSAYFLLTDVDDDGNLVWDGLDVQDIAENINILIDWEMSIKNNGGN